MKIYIEIKTSQDVRELESFCLKNNIIHGDIIAGTWYLDNVMRCLVFPNMHELSSVPRSFILTWDYSHISALYNNEIIGRFNQGKLQWSMMDYKAMEPMIEVLMYGAKKYDRDNWKKACPKKLDLLDSLQRHYVALVAGEMIDPESKLPHIGHLMCNAMFYSYWEQKTEGLFEDFTPTAILEP